MFLESSSAPNPFYEWLPKVTGQPVTISERTHTKAALRILSYRPKFVSTRGLVRGGSHARKPPKFRITHTSRAGASTLLVSCSRITSDTCGVEACHLPGACRHQTGGRRTPLAAKNPSGNALIGKSGVGTQGRPVILAGPLLWWFLPVALPTTTACPARSNLRGPGLLLSWQF
jgi:hypothetical protein